MFITRISQWNKINHFIETKVKNIIFLLKKIKNKNRSTDII